ncbi:MAG TPA: biotin/lipoyl-containing protein, partial [Methyloceanibacter sp.]|nr:biotin/lipoyl-containing protein [Methyloceanibacter sp.]
MPIDVLMPALSPTMEEGTLAKWLVREGDLVRAGDVIAEIETDKATMEVEAADDGRLSKILVPEGTEHVRVNQPIAVLFADDEATAGASPFETRPPAAPQAEDQSRREGSATHPEEGASAPVSKGEARDIQPSPQPSPQRGEGIGRELGEAPPDIEAT